MKIVSRSSLSGLIAGALLSLGLTVSAQAETTLRLSTLAKPGSDAAAAAEAFAKRVEERTGGSVKVGVYPASQLGDWAEVHAQVIEGAIDLAMQPLSTEFDKGLAIAWFPYMTATYDDAEKAFSEGGFVANIVDKMIAKQGLKLLGVFGDGMGGAGFAKEVNEPGNPDASKDIKIRVWPGGTTHQVLMQRLGYNVAVVPWAELYTGMQTGVVDGQIGGTAQMALDNFKDITNTWVQYNDHFELSWFFMNLDKYNSLSEEEQGAVRAVAQEITKERFAAVRKADAAALKEMRGAGINVVTFDDATLKSLAATAQKEVWPKIADEVGEEVISQLNSAVGM